MRPCKVLVTRPQVASLLHNLEPLATPEVLEAGRVAHPAKLTRLAATRALCSPRSGNLHRSLPLPQTLKSCGAGAGDGGAANKLSRKPQCKCRTPHHEQGAFGSLNSTSMATSLLTGCLLMPTQKSAPARVYECWMIILAHERRVPLFDYCRLDLNPGVALFPPNRRLPGWNV